MRQAIRLSKVKTVRYLLAGKSVRKGTPNAHRTVTESRKWYARLRIAGKQRWFPLSEDKREALKMAKELQRNRLRLRYGLGEGIVKQKPLAEHLTDYLADLQSEGKAKRYLSEAKRRLNTITKGMATLEALTSQAVDAFLLRLAKEGKAPSTRNDYRQAVLGFCNWLVKKQRLSHNPLQNTTKAKAKAVRLRRALSVADLTLLLSATDKRSQERGLLYRLALYTGLRKSELKALRVGMLSLEGTSPCLRLPSAFCKNGKEALLPLPKALASALRSHCEGKSPSQRVVKVEKYVSERMQEDLKEAGLPYQDESGRYADFHSLRKCTATLLALAGVHPRIAQQILRHSTIDLTMGCYTDVTLLPLAQAVDALPTL